MNQRRDPPDTVEIAGMRPSEDQTHRTKVGQDSPRSRFLSVWFRCCHVYGRIYRNTDQTAYEGRCPKCGVTVRALIGPNGTARRAFQTG